MNYEILTKIAICLWAINAIDAIFFEKKRIRKWYQKYRKEMVDGIVADLKKSDQTLVIKEDQHYHKNIGDTLQ